VIVEAGFRDFRVDSVAGKSLFPELDGISSGLFHRESGCGRRVGRMGLAGVAGRAGGAGVLCGICVSLIRCWWS